MKQKEEKALSIIQANFPGKKVIPIQAEAVAWGGGSLHCITQQEPIDINL